MNWTKDDEEIKKFILDHCQEGVTFEELHRAIAEFVRVTILGADSLGKIFAREDERQKQMMVTTIALGSLLDTVNQAFKAAGLPTAAEMESRLINVQLQRKFSVVPGSKEDN